jgi:hypothetical protein
VVCAAAVTRLKLRRDRRFGHLTPLVGRWRWCGSVPIGVDAANLRTSGPIGVTGMPRLSIPLAEIGWHADAGFMTERLQVRRKRHERLDIATRSDCRKEYAHHNSLAIILELRAGNQR